MPVADLVVQIFPFSLTQKSPQGDLGVKKYKTQISEAN
jgi:hypothetical protein